MPIILLDKTDDLTEFTTAIVQDAGDAENHLLPGGMAGTGGYARNVLRTLSITSVENLAWQVMLFSKAATMNTADPATDTLIGIWSFLATAAQRIAGAGLFYYYLGGLDVPLVDLDATGKLHIMLVNRSVAAKSAGVGGLISIQFGLQPMSQLTG